MSRRTKLLSLVGILIVGAALRFYNIGSQSLWFDELLSVSISRLSLADVFRVSGSVDPPLYYVLLHFWLGLAHSDGAVRVLSALASLATIVPIYLLGSRLFDERVGLTAALFFAIAPLQVFYAQEARMYSLLVLFAALSLWAFLRAIETGRTTDWLLWAVLMALALYSHVFAGLLLLGMDVDALWHWRERQVRLFPILVSNLAVGLLVLPWLALLIPKMGYLAGVLWMQAPSILQPFLTLESFIFGYTLTPTANIVALFVTVFILALTGLAIWRTSRKDAGDARRLRLLVLTTFAPLLAVFIVSQWFPIYLDRWLLEITPGLAVLLAWGLVASGYRPALRVCAIVGLLLMLAANASYFVDERNFKPPYRQSIEYIAAHRAVNEPILHTSDSTMLAGNLYDPAAEHVFLYDPSDRWLTPFLMQELGLDPERDVEHAIKESRSFWLAVALDHIPEAQKAEKAMVDLLAVEREQVEIGGIGIYHYATR